MKWITTTNLAAWAPKNDCRENFPLLIRKLIRASSPQISKIQFPSGDNMNLSGWDGILECNSETTYVPSGISVWEIGTGKDYEAKAEKDFRKRSKNSLGFISTSSTFVFVTPYIWEKKNQWIEKKRKENAWLNIEVIDGILLEEWVDWVAPVGIWLAKYLEIAPTKVSSLDDFWNEWSKNPNYEISIQLVTAGRSKEVNQLKDFLLKPPACYIIKASTIEESIAFIAAGVYEMNESDQEDIFSRTVIIKDESSLREIIVSRNHYILILPFETGGLENKAVLNGHHVILPVDNSYTMNNSDKINLPRIRRIGFEEGLKKMGFSSSEAANLAVDSGQSLSVLRRKLQFNKDQPRWAKSANRRILITALLIGRWDGNSEADKLIISELAEEPYKSYIIKLSLWKFENDAPILEVKSVWKLTSALDAFSVLSPFLTQSDLENFKKILLKVLNEFDQKFDPAKQDRVYAYVADEGHSYFLKQGLCQTLILMAVFGDSFDLECNPKPQSFVDNIVHELLFESKGEHWCSLSNYLTLLAEASPDSFLTSIETSLTKEIPPVMALFGNANGGFTNSHAYTDLLWALEGLAFSPKYLLRVTLILGALSRLDPGGNLHNSPMNSLRSIFVSWYNQTDTDPELRKSVLHKLMKADPNVAFDLFIALLPILHATVSPIHSFRWRFDIQSLNRNVSYPQTFGFNSFLLDNLLILANNNEERLSRLIECYADLNIINRNKLLIHLKAIAKQTVQNKFSIWNNLREILSRHRECSDTNWAIPEDELKKVEKVFRLFKPKDIRIASLYLFENSWPAFAEGVKRKNLSQNERQKYITDRQSRVLKRIYLMEGLNGIMFIAERLNNLESLGKIAATNLDIKSKDENFLLSGLAEGDPKKESFLKAYISAKANKFGKSWTLRAWRVINRKQIDAKIKARFFLCLPFTMDSWILLKKTSTNISQSYWNEVQPFLFRLTFKERLYVINQLESVSRYKTVLHEISDFVEELPSFLIIDLLSKCAITPSEKNIKLYPTNVYRIFEELQKRTDISHQQFIQIEHLYISLLTHYYSTCKPVHILNELGDNPSYFVELSAKASVANMRDEIKNFTQSQLDIYYKESANARKILDALKTIPGTQPDVSIDKLQLINWVTSVRELATRSQCIHAVDSQIGSLFACFPRTDDHWPLDEICEIIDRINSESMISNFETDIYNGRGAYVKSVYEGGNQERSIAAYFQSMGERISNKWPITASILFKLSDNYIENARREDDSAYLDELR